MGKVAVIETGYGEHANDVKQERHQDGGPAPSDPKHPQAHHMHQDERNDAGPVHGFGVIIRQGVDVGFGIEPSDDSERDGVGQDILLEYCHFDGCPWKQFIHITINSRHNQYLDPGTERSVQDCLEPFAYFREVM